jgi:hypothetical protein
MPGPAIAILADQREALRMLAGSPLGTTESIMIAHGFGIGTLHDSVRNGGRDRRGGTVRVGGG